MYTNKLNNGVSLIHIRPGCRIAGDNWIISGIVTHTVDIALRFSPVAVVLLNLSDMISSRLLTHHLRSPKWSALPIIKNVKNSQLNDPTEDITLVDWSTSTKMPWWPIIVLLIVLLLGCLISYYVYRQNGCRVNLPLPKSCPSRHIPTSKKDDFDIEELEMTPADPAERFSMMSTHANLLVPPPE